ncbi:MAG: hypothetical protein C4538_00350 [Nitrospiraceae bacterium]|nr:MAG: hypothetical protein C4538_00350 [Nitrospiraceae bacterium]
MIKLRHILFAAICIPILALLIWLFAVPENLLQEKLEGAISGSGPANVTGRMKGFRKGIFFSVYSDNLELSVDGVPALTITELKGTFDPHYIFQMKAALSVKGKIGAGDINGLLISPAEAEIRVHEAEISAIPYLSRLGIKSKGYASADISIKDSGAHITFQIPDLAITESSTLIPFIETFHKTQGVLSITGNTVSLESVGIEGDKGYARLKGDITNRVMDLNLELMPEMGKLTSLESMLIVKYMVSPGYYVIPVKGPVM